MEEQFHFEYKGAETAETVHNRGLRRLVLVQGGEEVHCSHPFEVVVPLKWEATEVTRGR